MSGNRSEWNKNEILLRKLLQSDAKFEEAKRLFLLQHAQVHSNSVSGIKTWSYEDDVLSGIPDEQFHLIPPKCEHSLAWILWHLTRCEDITMNLLVAEKPQILSSTAWQRKINSSISHTGNGMTIKEVSRWGKPIDVSTLRAYRKTVGKQTRRIVQSLKPEDLDRRPSARQIEWIWEEDCVLPNSATIVKYWSKRTTAGLLLMPATRHIFTHLHEAEEIRRKLPALIAA